MIRQESETHRRFSRQVLIVSGEYHVMSIISENAFTALYNTVLLFCCSTVWHYQSIRVLESACGVKLAQAEGY